MEAKDLEHIPKEPKQSSQASAPKPKPKAIFDAAKVANRGAHGIGCRN